MIDNRITFRLTEIERSTFDYFKRKSIPESRVFHEMMARLRASCEREIIEFEKELHDERVRALGGSSYVIAAPQARAPPPGQEDQRDDPFDLASLDASHV
jgi:hypothetical protein